MSQIRTTKAVDVGAFPGSTFVIDGSPPISQCQETQIVDATPDWTAGLTTITITPSLAAIDVTGKKVTIFNSPNDDGTWNILSQNGQIITTNWTFIGPELGATATIHDAGQAYLTRNESSFQRFIEDQGKAHTTKAGQLYTDLADPPMDDACSDTWAPG